MNVVPSRKLSDLEVKNANSEVRFEHLNRLFRRLGEYLQVIRVEIADADVPCLARGLGCFQR